MDAFIYLGPPDLSLNEQWPIDIAIDDNYRKELTRRDLLMGMPEGSHWSHGFEQEADGGSENPFLLFTQPDLESHEESLLGREAVTWGAVRCLHEQKFEREKEARTHSMEIAAERGGQARDISTNEDVFLNRAIET